VQPFAIGLWWRNGEHQVPYPSRISGKNRSDSATASLTRVFNATLANETVFGVTHINFPNSFDDPSRIARSSVGFPYQGVFGQSAHQIPSLVSDGWGGTGPLFFNPGGFDPVLFARSWQIAAQNNTTKVVGAHTLKAGIYLEHVTNAQPGSGSSNGTIVNSASGINSTGNTFADILLGRMEHYEEQSRNALHDLGFSKYEGFVQDSWKIRPNITLDLGIRASYDGYWYDRQGNGIVAFDFSCYDPIAPASSFPGLVYHALDPNVPLSGVSGMPFYVSPRVGAAWDTTGDGTTSCGAVSASTGITTRSNRTTGCWTSARESDRSVAMRQIVRQRWLASRDWLRAISSSAGRRLTFATTHSR
jgi:hypothetical protein